MPERSDWRYFDRTLLIAVVALCGIGIAMIYSATANTVDLADYWQRQLIFLGIGLVGLFVVAAIDYRHLELLAQPAYLAFLLSLVAVFLVGTDNNTGARRWLDIGITVVQPTEAGKFALIIFLSWYLSRFQEHLHRISYLLGAVFLLVLPLVLVYVQPDLGMTITYLFIGGVLILVSGVRLWQVALLGGMGLAALPFLWGTLQGYMLERIRIFLDPQSNPDASFNVIQALISIGNGGLWGMGWLNGSQNQLHFLRVRHSDFIFSVIAEELGFVGTTLILALLFFVIARLVRIADRAQDEFGRLITLGVAALLFFQTAINVGMNMGLAPVTGMTLPFLSYGGSSLVSMLMAVGLAQSVIMRHRTIDFLT